MTKIYINLCSQVQYIGLDDEPKLGAKSEGDGVGGDKLHVRRRRRGRIPLGIDVVWFMGGGCPFYREG